MGPTDCFLEQRFNMSEAQKSSLRGQLAPDPNPSYTTDAQPIFSRHFCVVHPEQLKPHFWQKEFHLDCLLLALANWAQGELKSPRKECGSSRGAQASSPSPLLTGITHHSPNPSQTSTMHALSPSTSSKYRHGNKQCKKQKMNYRVILDPHNTKIKIECPIPPF